jgi:hypothetical protein
MQDINQLRAMIKAIPATREGNEKLAMLANDPDPMKRMLAGIEANNRVRTRAQRQAEQGQQQQGRRPVVQEKMDELMQAGIGGLDMNEDMYGQGMAAGGIVAFSAGGDTMGGFDFDSSSDMVPSVPSSNLSDEEMLDYLRRSGKFGLPQAKDLQEGKVTLTQLFNKAYSPSSTTAVQPKPAAPAAAAPTTKKDNVAKPAVPAAANPNQPPAQKDPFTLMQEYLRGDAAERAAARKEARNMALLETGLAMLGGDSPYAGVNIGRAGAQGARGYGEKIAGLRKEERDVGKSLSDLELKKYELGQAERLAKEQRQTQKDVAGIYASARGDSGDKLEANIRQKVSKDISTNLIGNREYNKLKTQAEKDAFRRKLIDAEMATYGFKGGAAGKSWEGWSGGPQG